MPMGMKISKSFISHVTGFPPEDEKLEDLFSSNPTIIYKGQSHSISDFCHLSLEGEFRAYRHQGVPKLVESNPEHPDKWILTWKWNCLQEEGWSEGIVTVGILSWSGMISIFNSLSKLSIPI
ncbi:uncharacterized protein MELLADRAFT_111380 [Melampsora larici-populina 98AG31]|uniref:Uncharacterized protein n=1 Tax=Melampsora larici-populina (strain 98AG31 / pathotype 3-4-7) TaxID=747676 RepID=F4S306_MELLP|nr:uncharacterized protein MELLADRAFT_111380 [Melampsora larici-populina 98AG31]EGG00894.1 hypothetical protein MELLADRAFT_111380 [Melampsora larici-populina 98AG31]